MRRGVFPGEARARAEVETAMLYTGSEGKQGVGIPRGRCENLANRWACKPADWQCRRSEGGHLGGCTGRRGGAGIGGRDEENMERGTLWCAYS